MNDSRLIDWLGFFVSWGRRVVRGRGVNHWCLVWCWSSVNYWHMLDRSMVDWSMVDRSMVDWSMLNRGMMNNMGFVDSLVNFSRSMMDRSMMLHISNSYCC